MDNFIGLYENAIPKQLCEHLVQSFDTANNNSQIVKDDIQDYERKDTSFRLGDLDTGLNSDLNMGLNMSVEQYREEYPVLKNCSLKSYNNKMQVTQIGGGYHNWHFESSSVDSSNRLLFWLLYLNDVEEGGETEFLYQNTRVKPKTGTLIIAPASYTHTHRGNPPLSNVKYIATGWYHFF